jgi:hypothetical protein
MAKDDVKKLQESVDLIAKTTAHILENMATKQDIADIRNEMATKQNLLETESRLQDQINVISQDVKSFKEEVRHELLLNK